eukprot:SAG11_NODE_12598_length_695_cov_0.949664_1_plen_178_part_01
MNDEAYMVQVQKQRKPGLLPESMGSLACLFYRQFPSIRNALEGSQHVTGIEDPHERVEPRFYQADDLEPPISACVMETLAHPKARRRVDLETDIEERRRFPLFVPSMSVSRSLIEGQREESEETTDALLWPIPDGRGDGRGTHSMIPHGRLRPYSIRFWNRQKHEQRSCNLVLASKGT